jgi:hypothetical protein
MDIVACLLASWSSGKEPNCYSLAQHIGLSLPRSVLVVENDKRIKNTWVDPCDFWQPNKRTLSPFPQGVETASCERAIPDAMLLLASDRGVHPRRRDETVRADGWGEKQGEERMTRETNDGAAGPASLRENQAQEGDTGPLRGNEEQSAREEDGAAHREEVRETRSGKAIEGLADVSQPEIQLSAEQMPCLQHLRFERRDTSIYPTGVRD